MWRSVASRTVSRRCGHSALRLSIRRVSPRRKAPGLRTACLLFAEKARKSGPRRDRLNPGCRPLRPAERRSRDNGARITLDLGSLLSVAILSQRISAHPAQSGSGPCSNVPRLGHPAREAHPQAAGHEGYLGRARGGAQAIRGRARGSHPDCRYRSAGTVEPSRERGLRRPPSERRRLGSSRPPSLTRRRPNMNRAFRSAAGSLAALRNATRDVRSPPATLAMAEYAEE